MIERLLHPADELRPVPWWSWTGRLEYGEMGRQLRMMSEQGIREFFLFPCYGLEHPVFLEESWWEYVGFALDENIRGVVLMRRWHSKRWTGKNFAV